MTQTRGKLISDGGEGYIYEAADDPNLLMKIFKESDLSGTPIVTDDLNEKLKYMEQNPPEILIEKGAVAWPIRRISEIDRLAGFFMPKLKVDEHIQRTYSYRHPMLEASEYKRFPSVKSRIKIAVNLCSAIDELHRKGYVFGDFNHHNVGVNYKTGQVCFMDCDSFHITDNKGKVFRTNVIMAGYLAPEIIAHCNAERAAGRPFDLDKVALPTFTRESDLFCLAVHIFKLLMNGVDPFRGIKYDVVGSNASPFVGNEAIERDSYVFKPGNKPSAIFCPSADSLPPDVLSLFNRTFIDGRNDPTVRTSAADWYIILNRFLSNELAQCNENEKHYFYKYLDSCPYCTADNLFLTEHAAAFANEPVAAPMKTNAKQEEPVSPSRTSKTRNTGSSSPAATASNSSSSVPAPGSLSVSDKISIKTILGWSFITIAIAVLIMFIGAGLLEALILAIPVVLALYAIPEVYRVCYKETKNYIVLIPMLAVLVLMLINLIESVLGLNFVFNRIIGFTRLDPFSILLRIMFLSAILGILRNIERKAKNLINTKFSVWWIVLIFSASFITGSLIRLLIYIV